MRRENAVSPKPPGSNTAAHSFQRSFTHSAHTPIKCLASASFIYLYFNVYLTGAIHTTLPHERENVMHIRHLASANFLGQMELWLKYLKNNHHATILQLRYPVLIIHPWSYPLTLHKDGWSHRDVAHWFLKMCSEGRFSLAMTGA